MNSYSLTQTVERARPLLGTTVIIRVEGVDDPARAHAAISSAFAAIAHVHARMSFHDPESDLSRLHRAPVGTRIDVDEQTVTVLREAARLAELTDGVFDVTIGHEMVRRGLLPAPQGRWTPDTSATWRDVEIFDDGVRLQRALWIDLGGIAKGFAVDQAIEALRAAGITHACADAGGDLRAIGNTPSRVAINSGMSSDHLAVLELREASLATSTGRAFAHEGIHLNGQNSVDTGLHHCASVVSPYCIHADALTKVTLALGAESETILQHYSATAYVQDDAGQWAARGSQTQWYA